MKTKKGDFVEVEYTGKIKDSGEIFDTTDEKLAKENKVYNAAASYGPVVICLGEKHILPGIDDKIEGRNIGEYDIELKPEEGFGKKDAKLLRLVPRTAFLKQQIQPMPGLQVNMDGHIGTVKTVTGGRCVVDFNHPLSGKELSYHIKINKIVEDVKDKISALIKLQFGLKDFEVKVDGEKAKVILKMDIPDEIKKRISEKVKELTKIAIDFEVKKDKEEKEKEVEKKRERSKVKTDSIKYVFIL